MPAAAAVVSVGRGDFGQGVQQSALRSGEDMVDVEQNDQPLRRLAHAGDQPVFQADAEARWRFNLLCRQDDNFMHSVDEGADLAATFLVREFEDDDAGVTAGFGGSESEFATQVDDRQNLAA